MRGASPCISMAVHSWCTCVCGLVSASEEVDPHSEASGYLPWPPGRSASRVMMNGLVASLPTARIQADSPRRTALATLNPTPNILGTRVFCAYL